MEKRLNIMGVDPGGTTGIAIWRGTFPWKRSILTHYQFSHALAVQTIGDFAQHCESENIPLLIGCETFISRRGRNTVHTMQNDALEIIGAVKRIAEQTGATLSMQMPAVAKMVLDDKGLKKFGWWVSSIEYRHANDAARHIGCAMLNHYPHILMALHEQDKNAASDIDE